MSYPTSTKETHGNAEEFDHHPYAHVGRIALVALGFGRIMAPRPKGTARNPKGGTLPGRPPKGGKSAIPANLRGPIGEKLAEGLTQQQIVAWLKAEHGVETTQPSVSRYVRDILEERRDIAQAVVREKLAGSLTTDLERIESMLEQAEKRMAEATSDGDFARLVTASRGLLDLKTKLSGAQQGAGIEGVRGGVIVLPAEES